MKRALALLLALLLLTGSAAAASTDALGLYIELDGEQTAEQEALARQALALILDDGMTDGEKALVIHDWVVLNCRYSLTLYRDMAYGVLKENLGICRGYARAYVYLAEMAGLPCEYSFSAALEHAWALVELDGSYYYADPTWDDNHYARIGTVSHRHLFFNSVSEQLYGHYGGDSPVWAMGGPYEDAPWRQAVTRVVFDGDDCYFINTDFELVRCNRASWDTETLWRGEELWPGFFERDGSAAVCSGLVLLDGRLWFNTPTAILSVPTDGGAPRTELAPDTGGAYLCGVDVQDGRLVYSLATEAEQVSFDVLDSGVAAEDAWGCEPAHASLWQALLALAASLTGNGR